MVVKDNSKTFEKLPTGLQPAICHSNIDLGMQVGFQGKMQHKVALVFELLETHKEGELQGKRFIVTNSFTAGLNEKSNLSKSLESWRGKKFTPEERAGFELDKLKGIPCTLNMIEKEKSDGSVVVVIGAILPKLKTSPDAALENPPDFIPSWIAKMLGEEAAQTSGAPDNFDDDIPF